VYVPQYQQAKDKLTKVFYKMQYFFNPAKWLYMINDTLPSSLSFSRIAINRMATILWHII